MLHSRFFRWTKKIALVSLALFAAVPHLSTAQCVDSSEANGFLVRQVRIKSRFGLVPSDLEAELNQHRGEPYEAGKASDYEKEVLQYLAGKATQHTAENLVAQRAKLVVSGRLISLECVEKIKDEECEKSFSKDSSQAKSQCVDVILKAYSLDVDFLNSSPYLVLLPRSALLAFYSAVPRPILRLNPTLVAEGDKAFGQALGVSTMTDLLAFGRTGVTSASNRDEALSKPPPGKVVSSDSQLEIVDTRNSKTTIAEKDAGTQDIRKNKLLLGAMGFK